MGALRPQHGRATAGGHYEDRVAMIVDDGSVPEFARYGGYITIGDRCASSPTRPPRGGRSASLSGRAAGRVGSRQASAGDAERHWRLGLRGSRSDAVGPAPGRLFPRSVALAGAPLQPHQHASDDQYVRGAVSAMPAVAHSRPTGIRTTGSRASCSIPTKRASGRWPGTTWSAKKSGLRRHLLPDRGAGGALRSDHAWQEGDTIPPTSAAVRGLALRHRGQRRGALEDGFWDVTLTRRAMDTGAPLGRQDLR
jgi:hypothetical protein